MPFAATWMKLEIIILSEVSQTEKDKYHMMSLICGVENMTQVKLSMKQKQIHRHRKQTDGCQGRGGVEEGRTGRLGLADANYDIEYG